MENIALSTFTPVAMTARTIVTTVYGITPKHVMPVDKNLFSWSLLLLTHAPPVNTTSNDCRGNQ
jgi:hypothetical protein